jgi:LmbE family N-acetylglucosaminyl deacetylase
VSRPDPTARVTPVNDLAVHGPVSADRAVPACALAVGAHPDDIEFGCGGTLAKWADAGATIHHLVLTDGSKGSWDPGRDIEALIAERQEEQRRAAGILGGGDVTFLGYTDGELHNGPEAQRAVARCIRTVRPDVVLSHDPWRRYRLHPDHRHAGFIVTDAIAAARDPHFFADLGLAPHRPDVLLLWEADQPNHVEDVEGFLEHKIDALLAHASQLESTMGIAEGDERSARVDFADRVRRQAATHGALAGRALGESFHLMDEL